MSGVSYDVIGDVHGYAVKLEALLRRLGYVEKASGWLPPQGRQAVFLGDLIDRGPEQAKVIHIVRSMVDAGHARCIMGNHEFNALGYATWRLDSSDETLRSHSPKNVAQHAEFLRQIGEGSLRHRELVEWFKTLPPLLDLGGIRAVHAWWHEPYVELVAARFSRDGQVMDDEFLHDAFERGSPAAH